MNFLSKLKTHIAKPVEQQPEHQYVAVAPNAYERYILNHPKATKGKDVVLGYTSRQAGETLLNKFGLVTSSRIAELHKSGHFRIELL